MQTPVMRLYAALSRLPLFKSYRSKIMLVAFLGTHVPLLTLLFWFLLSQNVASSEMIRVLLIALVATLVGTLATLMVLNALLRPILVSSRALRGFLKDRSKVALPTHFTDEAGTLMADTTVTLNRLRESMEQMENFDPQTGLPNRSLFVSRLQRTMDEASESDTFALVLVELSRLAEWNVTYGNRAVAEALKYAGSSLEKRMSDRGLVARMNESTFALQIPDFGSRREDALMAEDPGQMFSEPFRIPGGSESLHIESRTAVALFPGDGRSAEELMTNASAALHDTRNSAQSGARFYSREMQHRIEKRISLEQSMRKALRDGEFRVYLQPRLDLKRNEVLSAEALIRWVRPDGLVSPADFIPVAESNGFIHDLGRWILKDSFRILKSWIRVAPASQKDEVKISVNFSPHQFWGKMDWVLEELGNADLPGFRLEVEVTESVFLSPSDSLNENMSMFQKAGLSIALDDFGTGYSSLSYLRDFPVDRIKIDRSFIHALPEDGSGSAIVGSVIDLAGALNIATTAEGVETAEQLSFLRQHACDEIQGFFFARPMPEADFLEFVQVAG
ncbi:MAG: EAL domain-containing protein [Leptospiraceae bacterium]|nr:EAL domain-containing protein [Leptospiraceae bacterium]